MSKPLTPKRNPRDERHRRVKADVTNATNTNADVTGMGFPVQPGDIWVYEFWLQTGCDGSGGVQVAMSVPTNATHKTVVTGMGSSSTTSLSSVPSGTSSATAMNTVGASSGWIRVTGSVEVGDTAGRLQLRFKSATDTQTSTIYKGSIMNAWRVRD